MTVWLWLFVAIIFEVAGTTCLKLSATLGRMLPIALTVVFYVVSFSSLALTLKTMEVGIAYALWSGLGTALIATIGILFFGEAISLIKILSIALIIAGVVGLNLSGSAH